MSLLLAALEEESSVASGTPLDYGDDLRLFLDAENGVATSGVDVTSWTDQDNSDVFTVPGGDQGPEFEASSQNGLPGLNFKQPIGETFLDRKLLDPANSVDEHFSSGSAAIGFAAKLDRITDSTFNTSNNLLSKGHLVGTKRGYDISIDFQGSFRFRQRRADGSVWQIRAAGFYNAGDLVLGYVTYNGGNTSGSGALRLYDGSNFVNAGTVTVGNSSQIGDESSDDLIIGNLKDPSNASFNAPFEGPIFGIWFTRPANTLFDEGYLSRWIP